MSISTVHHWLGRRGAGLWSRSACICATAVLASIGATEVAAQPLMPSPVFAKSDSSWLVSESVAPAMAEAIPASISVDTANREEVRLFFRSIYPASQSSAMGWTGNYGTGAAGDTSAAFKEAVNLRVNFFRAMAGVPGSVTFNSTFSAKAQQAALMMSANNALSHTPPTNWIYYTADGAEAAGSSNLAIGVAGPEAVDGYIADPGATNAAVGHRRWVLYPQTQLMGTGDVPGDSTYSAANALWVFDSNMFGARPSVRESFVAWPPPGYVPYQVVYPRWSISYPNANFSNATVTMTRGGASVPVALAPVSTGFGENTLVWAYDNQDTSAGTPHARPSSDTTYSVSVSNVVINGQATSFNYDVIVFDPDTTGSDHEPLLVTGSATPDLNAANTYSVGGLYYATGFQWRLISTAAYSAVEGAESGSAGLVVSTTGSYNVISSGVSSAGNASFHLAHPTTATQYFQLGQTFLGTSGAQLAFRSRLGYAAAGQTARVQVSLDEGLNWNDVYTQAGSGGAGENSFSLRTVSLADLDGRSFLVRFAYTFSNGTYYPGTSSGIGWYVDEIAVTGVSTVTAVSTSSTQVGNQFSFTPTAAGTFALQARGVFYDQYPLDWGPAKPVTIVDVPPQAPSISSHPTSQTVGPNANVTFTVVASGVPSPTYQWRKDGIAISGATSSTLTLLNVDPGAAGVYSVVVTNSAGSATSNGATLTINQTPSVPYITAQPVSVNAITGGQVSFTVAASGYPAPTYQWRRNGTNISGATSTTYSIASAQSSHAGNYTVVVTNSQGSVTSSTAVLTVSNTVAITTQPLSQSVAGGAAATLSVTASGSNLSYQWYVGTSGDTTTPVAGANASSYMTPNLNQTTSYWVRVSSPAQTVNSATATVSVTSTSRFFFGNFGSAPTGTFGLLVRPNGSAVFLAQINTLATTVEATGFNVAGNGSFSFTPTGGPGTFNGQITASTVSGTVSGTALTFSGTEDTVGGSTAAHAGLYEAVIVNTSDGEIIVIAGSNGRAFVLAGVGNSYSGAQTTLSAGGVISVTLPNSRAVSVTISASSARIAGTTSSAGTTLDVSGEREDVVVAQRLINTSMRSHVQQGAGIMIAGFSIGGSGTKRLLIRGVGPTLVPLGVTDALSDPYMELYRQSDPQGSPPIATNDDWSDASNAPDIATVGAALNAFTLPSGSKDAAMLVDLPAGVYTAHVRGTGNLTGGSLVEMYDADILTGTPATTLANISMRSETGNGGNAVIAGFVVSGESPKRLLIRAVGSELGPLGVPDTLADPMLTVYHRINNSEVQIAANDDWGSDASNVSTVGTQVFAFPLDPGSKSAAMVIWLDPGVYTALATSKDGSLGVALVEVYEAP